MTTSTTGIVARGRILLAVVQNDPEHAIQFRGRRGRNREVAIGHKWSVHYTEPSVQLDPDAVTGRDVVNGSRSAARSVGAASKGSASCRAGMTGNARTGVTRNRARRNHE